MNVQVVILAAGQGKRMKSSTPKPLVPLLGKPLIEWILDGLESVSTHGSPIVVVSPDHQTLRQALSKRDVIFVEQTEPLGTGHALQACLPELKRSGADAVLVLSGDVPLISTQSLQAIISQDCDCVVTGFLADDPTGYGRLVLNDKNTLADIVEEKDASEEEKAIDFVNAGLYLFPLEGLEDKLEGLTSDNSQNEFYLTKVPVSWAQEGRQVAVFEFEDPIEAMGINTPLQLSFLVDEAKWQILKTHLDNGVCIDDPATTWIEADVEISSGTRVLPFTVIRRGVKISNCCEVGPFAHIREGTQLHEGAEVGNFTEIKNSTLGPQTKAKHLSYIGDAQIGSEVNVGAGTIFANYDGQKKHKTQVADNVFIGSGTILVAPVKLGAQSKTGAGAVVTAGQDVSANQTVIGIPAKPRDNVKGKK